MQFSKNHIAYYGATIKARKNNVAIVKMPNILLLVQVVLFTELSSQQIQFSKTQFCHFLVYMAKCPCAKIKKMHHVDPEQNASETYGQTERSTDKQV